ncbi:A/G-specific adenine glycosylase [Treponema sp. HNW]|uniref:A/G-specific adenine glycosylase n=1 Tax=Treponema sp. HNW TaxID=3116654 RepID=UPI003D114004
MTLDTEKTAEFCRSILDFYEREGRDFPWRHTVNPYEILVSEIMLQQTQTERVLPKYLAWLERFPDVESLAAAPLADVLALWSGLGYNRRARFLHEAAKRLNLILKETGRFPDTPEALDALPGIGPYTARAVCTFAFNKPEVFIETNIRSVYIFFFFPDAAGREVKDTDLLYLIEQTLYRENPRLWYYALMDYGAALKKKVENPSRKSRHYTKQSRFEGSLRQARGAIIRCLVNSASGCALYDIAQKENINPELLEKAACALAAEKIISADGQLYRIS